MVCSLLLFLEGGQWAVIIGIGSSISICISNLNRIDHVASSNGLGIKVPNQEAVSLDSFSIALADHASSVAICKPINLLGPKGDDVVVFAVFAVFVFGNRVACSCDNDMLANSQHLLQVHISKQRHIVAIKHCLGCGHGVWNRAVKQCHLDLVGYRLWELGHLVHLDSGRRISALEHILNREHPNLKE